MLDANEQIGKVVLIVDPELAGVRRHGLPSSLSLSLSPE
jgi:hypothetical protein